jgi:ribosomal protein S12 methylthiotransferase accessory factor YcaO
MEVARPPVLLQIVQERVNPDGEAAYGRIEEELARLCAHMNCPNRYLAIASLTMPREVWWLNEYGSQADVDRVAQGYANHPALMAAMTELAQEKKGLATEPIDLMTTLRSDLSDAAPWRIGEVRLAVIREISAPAKASGAVFQAPDGRAFVFAAASDQEEADRVATALGRAARVFEVRPEWSLPYNAWVMRNPELWKQFSVDTGGGTR